MKSGGGKAKGGEFERQICKKLSLWVSNNLRDDLFWRSAMSGGRATVRSKKGKETASGHGDITAVTPEGNKLTDYFIIECKSYKSLGFDSHLYGQGPLAGIWDKLKKECNGKKPILILKENRRPILIGLSFNCPGIVCLAVYWSNLHVYHLEDVLSLPFFSFTFLSEE
jgi:hypothetical protein